MVFQTLGRSVSAAAMLLIITAAGFAQVPSSQRVVLVIDENTSFKSVMANMPWLVGQGNANGYAANFRSDNGGSLLDYLWLASGSCHSKANCKLPPGTHDFNCNGNSCYEPGTKQSDPITDDNIFRELNNAGVSWKVYAQSYAAAGGTPTTPDGHNGVAYYRRHNGATWYSDILSDVNHSAAKIVDLSQLTTDLANGKLPRFMIIVPDGHHDAHDCPVGMKTCTQADKLGAADDFLNDTLSPILNTKDFQPGGSGLIFVTFDECNGGNNNGCGAAVYTGVIGPKVIPHTVSNSPYKHENTLRTMLDALNISKYPGAAATAAAMSDFFNSVGDKPEVVISSPADDESVNSPFTLDASAIPTKGHKISGWYVYVDGTAAYHVSNVDSISPSLKAGNGNHVVTARAWDTSGAFGDQTISISVGSTEPIVRLSTPANGANLGSPVNIIAAGSPTPGHSVSGWWIYVDGVPTYNAHATNSINANVPMSIGKHSVLTRVWDNSGAFGDQTVALTVSAKPAVAVAVPLPGMNVNSSVNVQASATPSPGHTITGWYVYVDGQAKYHVSNVKSINTNINVSNWLHTLLVRTWDSSGAYGDQSFTINVSPVAVNISTPMDGAGVASPVNIKASATSLHEITGWHIYVDGVDSYKQNDGKPLNASLKLASGSHNVDVRAWDSTGTYGDDTIAVTVP